MQNKIIKKAAVFTITTLLVIVALAPSINSFSVKEIEFDAITLFEDEVAYDVYFGKTSPPPKVMGNLSVTFYMPEILEHNTTYYWQIVAWNDLGESAEGPIWHFTTEVGLPSVETLIADPVGKTNATFNGKIVEDGGDTCQIRFRYREEGQTDWTYPSDWHGSYSANETFSEYVDGLNLSTLYEFEAGVKNSAGEEWGELKNFTTNANQPPVALISAPSSADKKTSVTFDGSGSYDPDGDITDYDWDFGDGVTDSGMIVYHSYQSSGTYNVILQVTDDNGAVGEVSHPITINNNAPTASWVADNYNINPGDTVTFDGTGSSDPDGDSLTYEWKLGDGTVIGTEAVITYTFYTSGNYQVILTVTDDDPLNPMSDSASGIIYVNSPPIADAGPDQYVHLFYEMPVEFDGSGSYDEDGEIVEYYWDFGDGGSGYGVTIEYSYTYTGEFTVTLTVTDDDGLTDDDTCIITVYMSMDKNNLDKNVKTTDSKDNLLLITSSGTPPNTPSDPYPEDGATDVPIDVILSWTGGQNHPPGAPTIEGPTSGKPGVTYDYTINAVDPDGDDVRYIIDWGDSTSDTTDYAPSGTDVTVSHSWSKGTYTMIVKAQDVKDAFGPEVTGKITIPRGIISINTLLLRLLERYPNMFPMLRYILGL